MANFLIILLTTAAVFSLFLLPVLFIAAVTTGAWDRLKARYHNRFRKDSPFEIRYLEFQQDGRKTWATVYVPRGSDDFKDEDRL